MRSNLEMVHICYMYQNTVGILDYKDFIIDENNNLLNKRLILNEENLESFFTILQAMLYNVDREAYNK